MKAGAPIVAGLFAWCLAGPGPANAGIVVEPAKLPPGGIALVRVTGEVPSAGFEGRSLHFFPSGDGFAALLGIDLETKPGRYAVRVDSEQHGTRKVPVEVIPGDFPVERLTVPEKYVELGPEALARVRKESRRLQALWEEEASPKLWRGSFVAPARGEAGSPFGLRRFFNGSPRSPHSGVDFRAPRGDPVTASNRGRVTLNDELFFTGKTVVLDHGLGLRSVYAHLSETSVEIGEIVGKGERIGSVGATGRVTGPHLHFSVRLGTARVDPMDLIGRTLTATDEEEG